MTVSYKKRGISNIYTEQRCSGENGQSSHARRQTSQETNLLKHPDLGLLASRIMRE